ncbi:MAG: PQQ-binding-like beta-propeller repeat protein, partial [Candidatus Eremiobacteraeota bacterium]|nr:PQQ-binding-like beta-propeller repeat protein [Candidatus Eremiobacteraeota bacterium]
MPARATDYLTYHADNARDGWNSGETRITQRNAGGLVKAGDYALDGEVDAQPLYRHGVAYVTTENNTLYAIAPRRGIVWRQHFAAPVPAYVGRCFSTEPTIGIFSTPVIDGDSGTIYLVTYSYDGKRPRFTLHAVSPAGRELRSTDISADAGNTFVQRQRAALLLSGGSIYVAYGGACDRHPETTYGRVLRYDASTFQLQNTFVTTASPRCHGYHYGTVWGLGFGPAADAGGDVFLATGNGCIDYARITGGAYSDAVLRLTPDLRLTSVTDSLFAPCTALADDRHDQEIGSGGVVLVPGAPYAIAGGKTGTTYVLDRSRLGGFHAACPDD